MLQTLKKPTLLTQHQQEPLYLMPNPKRKREEMICVIALIPTPEDEVNEGLKEKD